MKSVFSEKIQYKPYQELMSTWSSDQSSFHLSVPWVQIRVEVETPQKEQVLQASLDMDSAFLSHFKTYPISYILPRDLSINDVSARSLDYSLSDCDWVPPNQLTKNLWPNIDIEINQDWLWNLDEVLRLSRIGSSDLYDPLSVYTVLRRLRLKDESSHSDNRILFKMLERWKIRDEKRFFEYAKKVLRQTHHVTASCNSALSPAALGFAPWTEMVKEFIEEEKGHDLLILQSLKALGVEDPDEIQILDQTRLCIEILRYSAGHSFLAFCCAVGFFEGSGYRDEDPMGKLLKGTSRPDAALGIQRHYEINKRGNHSAVGEKFVCAMGPVDRATVETATRLNELLVISGKGMATELVNSMEVL